MGDIGKRIKLERERLGLKQDALGVAPKTQRFYESGERSPDGEYLQMFANLGADVLYILTGRRAVETLKPEESALLDTFRAMCPEQQATFKTVGNALAQPSGKKSDAA